jgi:hypothetical protein
MSAKTMNFLVKLTKQVSFWMKIGALRLSSNQIWLFGVSCTAKGEVYIHLHLQQQSDHGSK